MTAAPKVETTAYVAMLRRMIAAAGRRVGTGDTDDLAELVKLADDLAAAVQLAVSQLREEQGYSWSEIGAATGQTKQSAHQKWAGR